MMVNSKLNIKCDWVNRLCIRARIIESNFTVNFKITKQKEIKKRNNLNNLIITIFGKK